MKMTLEKLAVIINKGFQETQYTLNKTINNVAASLSARINNLEIKVDTLTNKVDKALYVDYINLESRVTKLEKRK